MTPLGKVLSETVVPNLKSLTLVKRDYNCTLCEDTQFVDVNPDNPMDGMTPCVCKEGIRLAYLNSMIPKKFKEADLETIKPIVEKHFKQAAIIEEIKSNPFESYLFLGKNGAGKTWFGYALFKNAALSGRRAIALSMAELISEFKRDELSRDDFKPQVTAEDLRQNHTKYSIFIDELEKSRISEFTVEKFFDLIKAARDFGHQLILTSNLTEKALQTHFGKIDEVWGASIMRRLIEDAIPVEMF